MLTEQHDESGLAIHDTGHQQPGSGQVGLRTAIKGIVIYSLLLRHPVERQH